GDDNKKFKGVLSPCIPSRVLHLRQIPSDATEADVIRLGVPFGKVTNLLLLKGKSQAFLELDSEEAAANMVSYYTSSTPQLYSQPVYVQYSNYKELKTDNLPNQSGVKAVLHVMNTVHRRPVSCAADVGAIFPSQSSVLRIIVENLYYPVTLEALYQIFSKFGPVLKIVTFTRNAKFQALLQHADPTTAYYSKVSLDGQNIYTACCTLRIDFSKLTDLKIRYNNEKSRDFTRYDLPAGESHSFMDPAILAAYGSQGTTFPQYAGTPGFVSPIGLPQNCLNTPPIPGPMALPAVATAPRTSVLLVSNLNPEAITPHGLFILFGVYGNVLCVKIMYKKNENALVQMADANQAQRAISNLNGQRVYGKFLRITFSKHQAIQLPREGQKDNELTKDYTNSPLHRYRNPGSKNLQNLFPPSATLHLSNIPPSVSVDALQKLFEDCGCTVKAFKFFLKNNMALIELNTVEEAIHGLIVLHNYDLGENHHLRVSFSNSII
ncbi:PTBP3 protein, partial [Alectura lathami]|nr:PTBP3 protein [Alectura lathami]